jgi:hypothetical protein
MYIVYDPYLSQLRDYSGDIAVEPMHSVNILSSVTLYVSNVVFLYTEKLVLLSCLSLATLLGVLAYYFEISLLCCNIEESLTCIVFSLDPVVRVSWFRSSIATTLLGINLTVLLPIVLPHPVPGSIYVRIDSTFSIITVLLQAVKVHG